MGRIVDSNLKDAVIFLINLRRGREHAISREELLLQLAQHGFVVEERLMREAIHELRAEGNLIGSFGGIGGGYFILESWPEVDEFCEHEFHSRAMDHLAQERVMRHAAGKKIGPRPVPQQLGLPMEVS